VVDATDQTARILSLKRLALADLVARSGGHVPGPLCGPWAPHHIQGGVGNPFSN
jgi:hypothetical protein